MKKRILSLALAICMLMSAMPVSHAGILSAGNSDTASVESSADEILSSGGILSSGDESSAWEPLPEQELSQGILSSGEGELFESELSQGILSSGEEENPGDELYQGILSPGNTEEFPEEPEIETEDRPGSGGLLVVQCGECGYLDNNHAKDCPVICPPVIKLPVIPVEERKPAIVYSETYFDTYAQLMTAETLEDFEATMDGLTDDQQDELFDLLSANEQEALDELEDTLTRQAIAEEPQKIITHAPATVESRSVALSAARRAALQQLGYELIVNVFGKIVETIEMLQSAYTTLETVTPVEDAEYQWQILADDVWVDIMGATEPQIRVSYAMVANLLDRHDAVSLRCEIIDGDDVSYTDPVEVCVEFGSDDVIIDAEAEEEPVEEFEELSEEDPVQEEIEETAGEPLALFALPEEPETVTEDAPFMLLAEEGEVEAQDLEIYDVTISYVFEDGTPAADPYTSSFSAGYHLIGTMPHRLVQGYKAGYTNDLPEHVTFDKDGITFSIAQLYQDINIIVTMIPASVKYTVLHYKQNINNDDYYLAATDQREGLTGSTVGEVARIVKDENDDWDIVIPADVEDSVENWFGFYPYQYEKPTLAADGSTLIEVYYDRYYYLMTFDLGDGAYGTEPIYARYEAALGSIPEPTRVGYTFMGWSLNGTDIVSVPSIMPAENREYIAVWEADDTAKVTFVFWGENPNDEEYSYLESIETTAKPGTVITYGTDNRICGQEEHTHDANCQFACGIEEHKHSLQDNCYTLKCTQASHSHTNENCTLSCTVEAGHQHGTTCYSDVGDAFSVSYNEHWVEGTETNGCIGESYYTYIVGSNGTGKKYIYINGTWYQYTGSASIGSNVSPTCIIEENHTHIDDCYTCGKIESAHQHSIANGCYELTCTEEEHTHSETCDYSCGKFAHTHSDACKAPTSSEVEANLWTLVRSDTVTVDANGTTVVNVYYDRKTFTLTFMDGNTTVKTIEEKWGKNIRNEFPIVGTNGKTYTAQRWKVPEDCTTFTPGTNVLSIDVMPRENITFTTSESEGVVNLYYYVESLTNEGHEYNGKYYTLYKTVYLPSNGYLTRSEEFHDIEGFEQGEYYPSNIFSKKSKNMYLYYTRKTFSIRFYNPITELKTETDIPFGASLGEYNFTPVSNIAPGVNDAPSVYEPGSVKFDGWYLNPECSGTKYDLSTHTMPAGPKNKEGEVGLTLYAKWVGVSRNVKFYLDQTAYEKKEQLTTHPERTVPHGDIIGVHNPTNGDFVFVGWFYMDNGVEKAFDFENMPIRQDLEVYGKWSSKIMMNYIVYYKTQDGVDISVAHPVAWDLSGSAIAGSTKTFIAKGGSELFTAYQDGYFPTVTSHSIVIEINEDKNEWYTVDAETKEREQGYTFWYVQRDAVPYLVRYVDENGKELYADKVVSKNRKAIVTENFVPITNYMPDAYQKQLVVTGAQDADTEWITRTDEEGGIVQIHPDNVITFVYKEDHTHAYYREIHYIQSTDGTNWLEYAATEKIGEIGKTYSIEPLNILGYTFDKNVSGTVESGELPREGMELKLYYRRNEYPYQVRYLEKDTGKQLAPAKSGIGRYQQQISESAIPIDGYVAVAPVDQTVYIRIETGTTPQLNVITFYYVVAETSLTINKTWTGADCYGQDAIFIISGDDLSDLRVAIPYDGGDQKNSVTITGLKVGTSYTVTEEGGWSWRFTAEGAKTIQLAATGNELTFTNTLNNDKIYWFDGSHWKRNHFGDPEETNE